MLKKFGLQRCFIKTENQNWRITNIPHNKRIQDEKTARFMSWDTEDCQSLRKNFLMVVQEEEGPSWRDLSIGGARPPVLSVMEDVTAQSFTAKSSAREAGKVFGVEESYRSDVPNTGYCICIRINCYHCNRFYLQIPLKGDNLPRCLWQKWNENHNCLICCGRMKLTFNSMWMTLQHSFDWHLIPVNA